MIVQRPFYRHIGVVVMEAADGASLVRLEPMAETANIRGDVHGGAMATMLDAALVNAARSVLPEGSGAATVSLSINYLAPGQGTLMARGRVVRGGRSLVSAEATITDADGAVVAQAIGTLRAIAPKA
ncbi:PaaI family thioesterase [Plastoroseomonas arctica]|uniref:PaaI family thioesterase n=1 Tax=Plastoroseomonas arctica TaxID=1509237 RepID=A0AAF1KL23_9PROT|nr:PaaI family thioesterase [Plastoroseomonas arctica]